MKQLITVVLDLKRWRVDPEAFQSIQLDISMIFYVGKLSSASCYSQNDRDAWSNGHHSSPFFESLRFKETGRFVSFTADKTVQRLVVSATPYRLSHQQQLKKLSSFIWR